LQASTNADLQQGANKYARTDTTGHNALLHLLLQSVQECFERIQQSKSDVLELKDIQLQAGSQANFCKFLQLFDTDLTSETHENQIASMQQRIDELTDQTVCLVWSSKYTRVYSRKRMIRRNKSLT
jgi:hypothetical protein